MFSLEFQTAFEHTPTLLPDGFRLCFGAFDDEDKIIGIWQTPPRVSTASFSDRRISALLDTVIPVPPIFLAFRSGSAHAGIDRTHSA